MIAQRIVRAKKTIRAAGLNIEAPLGPDCEADFASVLEGIYPIFKEGYLATADEEAG